MAAASDTRQSDEKMDAGRKTREMKLSSMGEVTDQLKDTDVVTAEQMLYTIDDTPPWYLGVLLGLQHFLVMSVSEIATAAVIADAVGMRDVLSRGQLISTILLVAGFATLLQTTLGNRLPIVQGTSASYILPLIAMSSISKWDCPVPNGNITAGVNSTCNATDQWRPKLNEAQGALIGAAVVNIVLGYSGILGLVLPYVSHLVVAVVITMLGLPLANIGANMSGSSWPIAITTTVLASILGQYMTEISVPTPSFNFRKRNCGIMWTRPFGLFPLLIAVLLVWFLCFLLTVGGALEGDENWKRAVRTDLKTQSVVDAPWFRFPLPFQWGMPIITASGVLGMLSGVFASTIESVGDYYACARFSGAPKPPVHAMNRGIGTEGLGSLLCGIWGSGVGTTSYSVNISVIALTKIASRRVVQFAACWMILFGVFAKLGALFATLPPPVIGGIYIYLIGYLIAAGLSVLQFVNMKRTRNLYVLGMSMGVGLSVPAWLEAHPNAINTGNSTADQILQVLLKSTMLVGGLLALILDNTLSDPDKKGKTKKTEEDTSDLKTYDFPVGMNLIRRFTWLKFIPFCPTFRGLKCSCRRRKDHNV